MLAADKEIAIQWLEKATRIIRNDMFKQLEQATAYINTLESLQETHTVIKTTNVNVRLALENLFLSF